MEPWYESILRSAGICPVREFAADDSPCRRVLSLGLEIHQDATGEDRQWVTAAGWGNPDAELYIIGTTPKWHTADTPGPNYAPVEADREEHALKFALSGFTEFLDSDDAELRETTKWTIALAQRWYGSTGDVFDKIFVADMILCPQHGDPSASRERGAYQHCMSRHLLRLIAGGPNAGRRCAILLGAGGTRRLYDALGIDGPVPTQREPVVNRPPDDVLPTRLIATLAPQGIKQSSMSCAKWLDAMIAVRDGTSMLKSEVPKLASRASISTKSHHEETAMGVSEIVFYDPHYIGVKRDHGRRWSMMQSFCLGGTVTEIIERAKQIDLRRSHEQNRKPMSGFDSEWRFFGDEPQDYPVLLRGAGWTVELNGNRWVCTPPAS